MLCEANEVDICSYLEKRKSCTNWWLILGKCIETIPGRHQETLPIWPWLFQCIQCCQESKSIITASRCMKHPRSFAFYFPYSQTKACPAAGRFLQSPQSLSHVLCTLQGTQSLGGQAPRCPALAPASSPSAEPVLTSLPQPPPHPAKATGTAQSWLLTETVFVKIQCCVRRRPVISNDPATNHSLLWGNPMPTVYCRHSDLVPDENIANKEHESILTTHLRRNNDGLQLFHLD